MDNARNVSLYITVFFWANIVGAISYAHIAFFSTYLVNLPESTLLINEEFGIRDANFWMNIHPLAIVSTILALILNRKTARKKLIAIPAFIYLVVMAATAIYFVPELLEFEESRQMPEISKQQWLERGRTWQYASWIRGAFMYAGFVMLLVALRKPSDKENRDQSVTKNSHDSL